MATFTAYTTFLATSCEGRGLRVESDGRKGGLHGNEHENKHENEQA